MFHYFEEFVAVYENHFERQYGYFRLVIKEVVEMRPRARYLTSTGKAEQKRSG